MIDFEKTYSFEKTYRIVTEHINDVEMFFVDYLVTDSTGKHWEHDSIFRDYPHAMKRLLSIHGARAKTKH